MHLIHMAVWYNFWERFNLRTGCCCALDFRNFNFWLLTSKKSESTGRATVAMATSCCLAFVASWWLQQLRSSWWPCRSNHTMKPPRLRHDLSQVLGFSLWRGWFSGRRWGKLQKKSSGHTTWINSWIRRDQGLNLHKLAVFYVPPLLVFKVFSLDYI